MIKRSLRPVLATALPLLLATLPPLGKTSAADLKSYDSSKPSFWAHPPPD